MRIAGADPCDGIRDGAYALISGGHRLRAARHAAMQSIPSIVHRELNQADILLLQITENLQREDLTPIEKAKAIDALMTETAWTASQCALKLGLTDGTVSKLLSLLSLSEELQRRIDSGDLPASAAYHLTKVDDPEVRDEFASKVSSGELTRDELSGAIKATKRSRTTSKTAPETGDGQTREFYEGQHQRPGLDLNSFVQIIEKLLNHAQQARSDGLTLDALLKRLATQRAAAKVSGEAA